MDASGKVSTAEDYAFAAAAAAGLSAPFTRGVYRKAADKALLDAADEIKSRALVEEPKTRNLEERQQAVDTQARTIRDTVTTKNEDADKAVPEHVRRMIEEEAGEVVEQPVVAKPPKKPKVKKKKDAEPAEPEPMTHDEVSKALDDLEANKQTDGWTPKQSLESIEALLKDPKYDHNRLPEDLKNRVSQEWADAQKAVTVGPANGPATPEASVTLTTDGKPLIVGHNFDGSRRKYAYHKQQVELAERNGWAVSLWDRYMVHSLNPANVLHTSTSREVLQWLSKQGAKHSKLGAPVTAQDKALGMMADVLLKIIPDKGLDNTPVTFSRHAGMKDNEYSGRGAADAVGELIIVPVSEGGKATLEDIEPRRPRCVPRAG
jgi:hypothetical protein